MTNKRIDYIDIAKGIGIISVYVGHSIPPETKLWNLIFLFHMPLFFFISGYLYKTDKNNFEELIIRKTKTILYPSFTLGMFAILVELLVNPNYHLSALYYKLPHVFWFLPTLFMCEVLIHGLWLVFKERRQKMCITIILLIIGIIVIPHRTPYDISLVPLCSSIYAVGNLFGNKHNPHSKNLLSSIFLMLPLTIYILLSSKTNNIGQHILADGGIGYIMALLGTYSILYFSIYIKDYNCKIKNILIYCGQNSLLIYALHLTFIHLIVYLFLPIKNFFGPIQYHMCFIVENIINLALIYYTVQFIKKKARWIYVIN